MNFIQMLIELSLITKILIVAGLAVWIYFFFHNFTSLTISKSRPLLIGIGIFAVLMTFAWGLIGYIPGDSVLGALPQITKIFIIAILTIWGYFFFFHFTPVTVANAPSVLTSLGIFGTFVGIAWGLASFDSNDIEGSIPTLLDGLTTAFWSSIVGIGGAVAIKLRHLFSISFAEQEDPVGEGTTIDDLANLLTELNKSLAGTEGTTVLGELKQSRHDSNERLENLKRSFEKAS